ncbi:MAG TPA: hypothetical protein VJ851_16395 [Jatrophihabitans sp.]|nr:hypothetical protein [Jatrophihabitans sp.]
MTDDRELSALMRDGMAAEAREISASAALTERLIRTSTAPKGSRVTGGRIGRGWQAWLLPVAAAVLVAVLVSTALVGGKLLHASRHQPGSSLAPQPGPSTQQTSSPAPSPSGSTSTTPTVSPTQTAVPVGGPVPDGFRAVDLTWVSTDQGWALGTAPCIQEPCTSIVTTTDGGKHWKGMPAPVADLTQLANCLPTRACIGTLRFATPQVGYAYGPSALFMTTDGGRHWQQQTGGANGLEAADGTVVRVISNCLPGCTFRIERANIGSTDWTTVPLPAGGQTSAAQLARAGNRVALLTEGHVSGGAQHATSVLFTSTDGGASWNSRGEQCPQGNVEYDSTAVTIAPDGSITILCGARNNTERHFTMTSTDGGAHFTAAPTVLGSATGNGLGAASASTLLVSLDLLYLSTDGGRTWGRVDKLPGGGPLQADYIGFETGTVGRVLETDANGEVGATTVWTTTDAGRSWTSHTFS